VAPATRVIDQNHEGNSGATKHIKRIVTLVQSDYLNKCNNLTPCKTVYLERSNDS